MSFIVPLIYFILANGFFVCVSKKTFGKCLPSTMMVVAFVEFFSQVLFGTFILGDILNLVLPLLFIIFIVYKKIKKHDMTELKENFITKGLFAFCVIYTSVYLFDFRRTFSTWDELSHWGVMLKEMFRLDKFYSVDLSNLMVHKDYPPIIQLFELFFAKLSGGYSESSLIISIHLMTFSLFIPTFCESTSKFDKKKFIIKTFCIILSVFLIIALFDQHQIINTIYIDYIMAVIVVYLFSIIMFEENTISKFNLFRICLGCSFLVLTKQIALPLYAMILFIFVMDIILKNKQFLNKEKIKEILIKKNILKSIYVMAVVIIIPALFWIGWNCYVKNLEVEQQFKLSDLRITELPNIISNTGGASWQHQATVNYIDAIKTRSMTTSYIELSYFQCMILTLCLIYMFSFLMKDICSNEKLSLLAITLFIGYIGYAFVMLVLYSFSFGNIEGPNLASFNRYLPTYVLICMLILFSMFIYGDSKKDVESKCLKKIIILACVLTFIQSPSIMNKFNLKISPGSFANFREHAAIITRNVEENSNVYIIAQDSVGEYQFFTKYYMDTINVNVNYYDFPIFKDGSYESYFNTHVRDYMLNFDYVYLAKINEEFILNYDFIFKDDIIEERKLYKITKENDEIKLSMIN